MKIKLLLLVIILCFPAQSFANHLINVDDALKKIYPKATNFQRSSIQLSKEQIQQLESNEDVRFSAELLYPMMMYSVFENDISVGYAFEDTVIGKWGPIHYLTGLDRNGTILQIMILDYDEIRGKPIAKRRFLKQYKGKTVDDPIRIRRDIDGVTGATISSRSLTDGVRRIVHISHQINNKNNK